VTSYTPYSAEDEQRALASMIEEGKRLLDIADDAPADEPPTFTGVQQQGDVRAVQLHPRNFSAKMIEKAGRLYLAGWKTYGPNDFEVYGESGEWYHQRVIAGARVWFVTCDCPARASRYNRAGACSHRALAGYLRAERTGQPIPTWTDLSMEATQ